MSEGAPISVKVKSRIKKYAEGVSPDTGEPFEIVEGKEVTLIGKDAEEYLKKMGVKR